MNKYEIYQIDAFTDKVFGGNPAGVIFADSFTESEKQFIAREMNLAETAFLSKSNNADYRLQWFTPATEVQLCGHATIASLHFLNEHGLLKDAPIKFETLSGVLNCGKYDGKYYMQIPVFNTSEFTGDKLEILRAIGISINETGNVPFILLENGYLYIHVKNLETLKNITPDFKALRKISVDKKEFFDLAVFTLETIDKNSFAHLRFFAPYHSIDEDPVTGSANGPLIQVLEKLGFLEENNISTENQIELTFEQGDLMNRRGRVNVIYDKKNKNIKISGNAVTVIKGELYF